VLTWWRSDLLAGVTVTAYLVPQVMAYAELAGLPPETGLWASLGALALYALVGSSPVLSVGPESTTALMTATAIGAVAAAHATPSAFATTLAIVGAALCLAGWLTRLSVVADLLSRSVLVGYLAGIALTMIVSQLGNLGGFPLPQDDTLHRALYAVRHLGEAHPVTLALGLVTLVAMLLASWRWPHAPVALAGMLGATAVCAVLDLTDHGVGVVGHIPAGLPAPGLPHLDADLLRAALLPALGIAFVGFTDNVLTARAFAGRGDHHVDAHRELLGLGAANLGSALLHGFPVSSSGSRTAIGAAVGARTRLAGWFTVVATAVALLTLRPVLEAFPSAALGAVVVYAAVRLIEVREFRRLWAFRRSEFAIAVVTAGAVVAVGVLDAVLVAIGLSILDLLRRVARPHDAVLGFVAGLAGMHDTADYPGASVVPGLVVYRYDSPLYFANAEDFRTRALAAATHAATTGPVEWFVLNAEAISDIDFTALAALESVRAQLTDDGIVFGIARLKHDLRVALEPSGFVGRVGADRLFPTLPTAVEAFHRAHPA
jgi:SulP family sulfate permease